MKHFTEYAKKETPAIHDAMDEILDGWQLSVQQWTPELLAINKIFMQSAKGGKMLRGLLIKLSYDMHSQVEQKDVYKIAAAYELIHTALLIHDDVIDKGKLRRGKPTVVAALGGKHYGISQAICVGDIGILLAQKTIVESTFSNKIKIRLLSEISEISLKTMLGEMLDVYKAFNKSKKEADVLTIADLKTAYYTVAGPLHIGALLAGKDSEKMYTLRQTFGMNLGIAFQIKDDILGIFSEEKKLGKSIYSDITEGKNTLLISHAMIHCSKQQQHFLKKYYGKKNVSAENVDTIKALFQTIGSLAYSEEIMQTYLQKAEAYVSLLTKDASEQQMLQEIIAFVTGRQK
jgi:geranylgeranyl diphosphate synthase type I